MAKTRTGWRRVSLGDCCDEVAQRIDDPSQSGLARFVGLEHLEPGELRIRSWGSTAEVASSMKIFQRGDVLVARRNVYLKRVAQAEFEGVCSGDAIVLRPRRGPCLSELLPYLVSTDAFWKYVASQADGTMSKRITVKRLLQYEFALPPMEEQRRIASLLIGIETLHDRLVELQNAVKSIVPSIFEALSARDLRPTEGAISDYCDFVTDGDHNPPPRVPRGIPHLVVANIRDGVIDERGCTYITNSDFQRVSQRYSPRAGDVLLSCVGSLGETALVPEGLVFSADRSLAVYRPLKALLIPEFALRLLQSQRSQRYFRSVATGTAQLHLYLEDLRRQRVKIPTIEVQAETVGRIREVEGQLKQASLRQSALTLVRDSVLREIRETP